MKIKKIIFFTALILIIALIAIFFIMQGRQDKLDLEKPVDITINEAKENKESLVSDSNFIKIVDKSIEGHNINLQVYAKPERFTGTTISTEYKLVIENHEEKSYETALRINLEDSVNNNGGCLENCISYYYQDEIYLNLEPSLVWERLIKLSSEEIEKINDQQPALLSLLIDFIIFPENQDVSATWDQTFIRLLDNNGRESQWQGWMDPVK